MRGIYQIRNIVTGDCYIGMATNIEQRWRSHRAALDSGMYINRRLQDAWADYGADTFEFTILEEIDSPSKLRKAEKQAITDRNPCTTSPAEQRTTQ